MNVGFVSQPILERWCLGASRRILLISSSLLLKLAYLVHLGWFVKWEASGNTAGMLWDAAFKTASSFFFNRFVKVQLPYNSIDMATARKNSHFILSERQGFFMFDNLLIAVHAFPMSILTLLSLDEILLLIIIIMLCRQQGYPWPSPATSPYRSLPPAGLQGYILYPHKAAVCMFKLVVLLLLGRTPLEYITYELVLASPAVSCISGSSSLDSFCDGRQVAI